MGPVIGHDGAVQIHVLRDLDGRIAVGQIVAADPERLGKSVVEIHRDALSHSPLERRLQRVILVVTDRSQQLGCGSAAELREVRLTGGSGAEHLSGVQIEALINL